MQTSSETKIFELSRRAVLLEKQIEAAKRRSLRRNFPVISSLEDDLFTTLSELYPLKIQTFREAGRLDFSGRMERGLEKLQEKHEKTKSWRLKNVAAS